MGNPDVIRRKYVKLVSEHTGRPLIIYAADFLNQPGGKTGGNVSIELSDLHGFEDALTGVQAPTVDVLVHSPGGSPEACESIVRLLRRRFSHVRFIIPGIAKSAATMLALSGNELLMDPNSELGPIDPQIVRQTGRGIVVSPAQSIIDQFEQARVQIQSTPSSTPAWYPILQDMAPSLLAQCQNAIELSKTLVADWLQEYMFAGDTDASSKAAAIAEWLGNHNNFRSHARRVDISELARQGVKVQDISTDSKLHNLVRSLYYSVCQTFDRSACYKFYENHHGKGLYRLVNTAPPHILIPAPMAPAPLVAPAQQFPSQPLNRQQRRHQNKGK